MAFSSFKYWCLLIEGIGWEMCYSLGKSSMKRLIPLKDAWKMKLELLSLALHKDGEKTETAHQAVNTENLCTLHRLTEPGM